MSRSIATPCIGICSSSMGDDVCRGCHRFAHEVIDWNSYSTEHRAAVFGRLDTLLLQIIKNKIQVIDVELLKSSLWAKKIAFRESADPLCWVYVLLKKTQGEGLDPEMCGFRLSSGYTSGSLTQLYTALDHELYQLSQAHYQRYLAPGIVAAKKTKLAQ